MAKLALSNAHGEVCVEQHTWQSLRRTTHMTKFALNNARHGCKPAVMKRRVQTSRDEQMFVQNVCPTTPYCNGACKGAPGAQAVDFTKCRWSLLISTILTL